MPVITVDGLSHVFLSADRGAVLALEDIRLTVPDGEFLALVGPSGCGKTTLLNIIAGLEQHRGNGSLRVDGHPPVPGDQDVGYMLSRDCLMPWRDALGNAEVALEMQRVAKRERRDRAREALAAVGLESFAGAYPAQLSQGMRQRVALARVFAARPRLLLLDEPFSALDAQTRITVQDLFLSLWQRQKVTVVLVTHDLSEAITLADRVLAMSPRPGRISAEHAIDLPRPRRAADLRADDRFHELFERIWTDLREHDETGTVQEALR